MSVATGAVTWTRAVASGVPAPTIPATPCRVTVPAAAKVLSLTGAQVTGRSVRPPCLPTPTTVAGNSGCPSTYVLARPGRVEAIVSTVTTAFAGITRPRASVASPLTRTVPALHQD